MDDKKQLTIEDDLDTKGIANSPKEFHFDTNYNNMYSINIQFSNDDYIRKIASYEINRQ